MEYETDLSPIKAFQSFGVRQLARLFTPFPVEKEWMAFRGLRHQYGPRLDLAVGPFATGNLVLGDIYDALLVKHRQLFAELWNQNLTNLQRFDCDPRVEWYEVSGANYNARCLLAIEIENSVSRKHLLGGAVNAAALGRIGVVVGWTEEKLNALVKLRQYLLFLADVGKPTFDARNLLIISRQQLTDTLSAL